MASDDRGQGQSPRKDQPLSGAPLAGRQRLGALLAERRGTLNLPVRADFARHTGVEWSLASDLENAKRDTFPRARLSALASVYRVTVASMEDVAWRRADQLEAAGPDRPAAAPDPLERARPPGSPGTWISSETIARADRMYMPAIRERLDALAARGITDPDGQELFPDDEGLGGAYDADRLSGADVYAAVWTAALVQERRERLRAAGRGPQHGSAGA